MDKALLAYLAGAMDSDGCFTIKRSTYAMRVRGDATQPVYSERAMLKQVTPQIPDVLKATFGGSYRIETKGGNVRSLYAWQATDTQASEVARLLFPFLRVKRRQAELLLELRESKGLRYRQVAYWFEREFPDWRNMEMLTRGEAIAMLGHTHQRSLAQATHNGMLLALPYRWTPDHGYDPPRFPRLLVERVLTVAGKDGRAQKRPRELIAWRERLWAECHELNKSGVAGTSTYFLTGHHTPAAA